MMAYSFTLFQLNTSSLVLILALFLLFLMLFFIRLPQFVLFLVHFQKGGSQFMYYKFLKGFAIKA